MEEVLIWIVLPVLAGTDLASGGKDGPDAVVSGSLDVSVKLAEARFFEVRVAIGHAIGAGSWLVIPEESDDSGNIGAGHILLHDCTLIISDVVISPIETRQSDIFLQNWIPQL